MRLVLAASLTCVVLTACPTPPVVDGGVADAGVDAGPEIITPNTAGWWRDKVFYEVFVRSFADSNGDGAGDLKGLTSKLDYLNDGNPATTTDLGVDAVWLMPIYPSPSYHGYDVTEYQAVNPAYGSLSDFDALVAAAHQRGLKIILDFVPNHTSSAHPWFRNARTDVSATYRDYYVWRTSDPGWKRPIDGASLWHSGGGGYFYGYFWGEMPDLNYRNPEVQQAIIDAMKFWLGHGVDGFRIDAARYLYEALDGTAQTISEQPETHAFIQRARLELHRTWPSALLVAEAWASADLAATYYGQGNEYQLAFAFDTAGSLVKAVSTGNASELINTLARAEKLPVEPGYDAPFLTNHDMVRVMQQLGGNQAAAKVAGATLLALPGTPFLYYGEELGMGGGPSRSADEDKRTPMRWNATGPQHGFTSRSTSWYGTSSEDAGIDVASEQADTASIWNTYRSAIALRHAHPALSSGAGHWVATTSGPASVFAYLRTNGTSRVLFLANFSGVATGPFTVPVPSTSAVPLLTEGLKGSVQIADSAAHVEGLAPWGFVYLSLP